MFFGTHTLLSQYLCTTIGNFFCFCFIIIHFEFFTGLRSAVQSKYNSGSRRTGNIFFLISFIEHCFYTAVVLTAYNEIA